MHRHTEESMVYNFVMVGVQPKDLAETTHLEPSPHFCSSPMHRMCSLSVFLHVLRSARRPADSVLGNSTSRMLITSTPFTRQMVWLQLLSSLAAFVGNAYL